MLANNIVRVNGWLNGKRTHADIEVPVYPIDNISGADGKEAPYFYEEALTKKCFEEGLLDGVTSINAYNWVGDCRITTRVW